MDKNDFYAGLSEKDARMMLAPLAAAVMLSSDEVKKSFVLGDKQQVEPWNTVREYESIVDILYTAFKVVHNID